MKTIKDYVNEGKYGVHRTWEQIECCLKPALKNCLSTDEKEFNHATAVIGALIDDAVDPNQMK